MAKGKEGKVEYQGYCVKCKKKQTMTSFKIGKMKNGMKVAKGPCPKCGTTMCRILGKA